MKFHASLYWEVMKIFEAKELIGAIRKSLRSASLLGDMQPNDPRRLLITQIRPEIEKLLNCCNDSGLQMSALAVERLFLLFNASLSDGAVAESLEDAIARAVSTIEDEISLRTYFSLEPAESKAWNSKEPFGGSVSSAFPSSDFELIEESRCYAIGRYTAAVFHLMRVLEIGMSALARNIGCDPANKSWETILQNTEAKVKENSHLKPLGWRETEQFYSEFLAHFRNLKNAWRNYTMHVYVSYDKERAEEIFIHVRGVMRSLSARIREQP